VAFMVGMSLCKKVVPYGFGVIPGKPYHAYKWCDVDHLFGVVTKDCPGVGRTGSTRTETGFKGTNTFHDSDSDHSAWPSTSRKAMDGLVFRLED